MVIRGKRGIEGMNNLLIRDGSSVRDIPERVSEHLEYCRTECVRYCRYGNMFATGTSRGQVALWESDTKSLVAVLGPKVGGNEADFERVVDVGFPHPRTGVTVLVAHAGGRLRIWNTLEKSVMCEVLFDSTILGAVPHPKRCDIAVVIPECGPPVILQCRQGSYLCNFSTLKAIHIDSYSENVDYAACLNYPENFRLQAQTIPPVPEESKKSADKIYKSMPQIKKPPELPEKRDELDCVRRLDGDSNARYFVSFTRDGKHFLRASDAGALELFTFDTVPADGEEFKVTKVASGLLGSNVQIRNIIMTAKGDRVLVHCTDKMLRLLLVDHILQCGLEEEAQEPRIVDVLQIFKDVVGQSSWRCATISPCGSMLVAAVAGEVKKMIMYNTVDGQIERTLSFEGEQMKAMAWNPRRSLLTTIGQSGSIYVWEKNHSENWSAFAPDFKELEANEEYVEKEDEFDLPDATDKKIEQEQRDEEECKHVVDVLGLANPSSLPGAESDDSDAPVFFIPPCSADDLNSPVHRKRKHGEGRLNREAERERERERGIRRHRSSNGNGSTHGSRHKRKRSRGSDNKKKRRNERSRRRSDDSNNPHSAPALAPSTTSAPGPSASDGQASPAAASLETIETLPLKSNGYAGSSSSDAVAGRVPSNR